MGQVQKTNNNKQWIWGTPESEDILSSVQDGIELS